MAPVVVSHRVVDDDGEIVDFETTYEFVDEGETIVSASTLRFIGTEALRQHLDAWGFGRVEFSGDWDGSPVTASSSSSSSSSSPEIIVVAHAG